MIRDRIIACLLLAVTFAGLVMQRIAAFRDIPEAVAALVTIVAVVSGLTGVWLWVRSSRHRSSGTEVEVEADAGASASND
ncbi:hypothetical protein [Micromonospora sp. NBC_01813]|uniref:hypothetical protein n=1 Tax=Micromonospora sp. NBC_01813 TaxID=2975988 RepID=UPI002DDAEBA0|nr:hypothetical protein [Micromonospora sp. NBC_01813]WSA09946.1 hypothetical protein OG958_03840 [Micromonospora sp. NBC_01813]